MTITSDELLGQLRGRGIAVELHEHPLVLTVEAMLAHCGDIPGAHTKNLFLRDGKKTYFLVTLRHGTQLDLKTLRSLLGARGGLSFASADALREHLGVESGAVSPLAALNAQVGTVRVFLEAALLDAERINVHPLVSTRTLSVAPTALIALLESVGHAVTTFVLPETASEQSETAS